MAHDEVNNPKHYTSGRIECIEAIEAALTPEELKGFLKGNIIKYTWRERHKGGVQSLQKAQWYLNRLLGVDLAPPERVGHKPHGRMTAQELERMLSQPDPKKSMNCVTQEIPKTLAAAIQQDRDAYDQVEAYHLEKGFK